MIKINEYESIQIVSYQDIKCSDEMGNLMWANSTFLGMYCTEKLHRHYFAQLRGN